MITIQKSSTADTRTCDVSTVSKDELTQSSLSHIGDVAKALGFFAAKLVSSAAAHDYDKLTDIDQFYADFQTGFQSTTWWDNHRKNHRHHLNHADGVPRDVNLIDIIEYLSDCVMAGMARSGKVYDIEASDELLRAAFDNTVDLLKRQVIVE